MRDGKKGIYLCFPIDETPNNSIKDILPFFSGEFSNKRVGFIFDRLSHGFVGIGGFILIILSVGVAWHNIDMNLLSAVLIASSFLCISIGILYGLLE